MKEFWQYVWNYWGNPKWWIIWWVIAISYSVTAAYLMYKWFPNN